MKIIIIIALIFIIYKVVNSRKSISQMSNADAKVSQQSAMPRQTIKRSNPHRILICDDAAFMRMMLKDTLTQDGYNVIAEAQDGLEAIERYCEFKPDLVFMDITMPKMDGIDATRKIREIDRHANIVVCSAMGQQEQVMEAIRLGAKDFIVKPFSQERILNAVLKIFEPWRFAPPPKETEQSQTVNTTPPVETEQSQTINTTPPVQEQSKQSQTVSIIPPEETGQSQAASHTPPVHTQSKQSQAVSTTPPQSILDTQTIFDYVKAMPVKWGYANPNVTPNKELQQLCNSFMTSWEIPKCYSPDSIQGMEYIIQKKHARTPDKADYNKVMEANMLFELYKYSYSMNIIKVLVDRKNDTVKINMSELMGLIQEDCRRHLSNLEYEKKTNPAIQDMLQKYNHDTQKVKMIINDYVEGREYDYIFSSLMTSTLMNIVNYILNTEMETAKGYQPTLQVVRQYPSSDLTAALDAYISSFIGMALNSYTGGGSIPRKSQ